MMQTNIFHLPYNILHMRNYVMKLILIILVAISVLVASCGSNESHETKAHASEQSTLYYCPMHPNVTSNKPGVCPICHMDLVKKSDSESMSAETENMISLTNSKIVSANVYTVKVKRENINKIISSYSYLDFAEPNRKQITARFNGRIERLFVDKTGDYVKKNQPLFEVYSPDLVQAQNDYLIALRSSMNGSTSMENKSLLNSARKKLELFGITDEQIENLGRNKEIKLTIAYYSPFSGTVIEKKIQEGNYINEGNVLYDIAELSTLWNIAEIYENDLQFIKVGDKVKLRLDSYPNETFEGKVNLIYPVVNSQTRTVKIRSAFSNSQGKLKPQMYGETSFEKNLGASLTVPENAVLLTGKRNIVWIKSGEGMYELREVKLGVKYNGMYQILSGLNEGEEVAATGAYLIDSESQLKSGSGSTHQHGDGASMSNPKIEKKSEPPKKETHQKHSSEHVKSEKKIFNEVCPILGEPISDRAPVVEYKGKLIGFCCKGCDKSFTADPEKYMKNLSADGKKFIGQIEDEE